MLFLDMDHYALHGPHSTIAISVPGSDVCIEGDQLRSKESMQFTDMTTDWSSCRWDLIAEDLEKVHCPDSAHKTKTLFDGYYVLRSATTLTSAWNMITRTVIPNSWARFVRWKFVAWILNTREYGRKAQSLIKDVLSLSYAIFATPFSTQSAICRMSIP